MRDNSIRLLLICLIILGIFLGAYEGLWKQGARKVTNYDIDLTENNEIYLEVIWDASGSMWGRDVGVEKIIRSKDVLKTFADQIPKNVNLGLRIFGARRVGDLEDSFLAIPFQEGNREDIINFITNVKPLGKSPIAYSLKEAHKDLAEMRGRKYVMLISDGIDNGEMPPETVIDQFVNDDIILHVVHIGEPEKEGIKEKLQEMAKKTGGSYFTYDTHERVIPTFSQ
ncbi:MAG: vWA domain-containing protein [bacterium]